MTAKLPPEVEVAIEDVMRAECQHVAYGQGEHHTSSACPGRRAAITAACEKAWEMGQAQLQVERDERAALCTRFEQEIEEQERIAAGLAAALRAALDHAWECDDDDVGMCGTRESGATVLAKYDEALRAWEARADG